MPTCRGREPRSPAPYGRAAHPAASWEMKLTKMEELFHVGDVVCCVHAVYARAFASLGFPPGPPGSGFSSKGSWERAQDGTCRNPPFINQGCPPVPCHFSQTPARTRPEQGLVHAPCFTVIEGERIPEAGKPGAHS